MDLEVRAGGPSSFAQGKGDGGDLAIMGNESMTFERRWRKWKDYKGLGGG
jgi:hypothetical protein